MSHSHDHATAARKHRGRLAMVFAITATVMVAQIVGGILSGSLALLADAGHMATDAFGTAMALIAVTLAQRAPTSKRTFGWQRIEILAAVGNAVLLFVVAIFVLFEAYERWFTPPEVSSSLVLVVAGAGLIANTISLLLLRRAQTESLNMRGAYLEVLGDLLGSVAVLLAAGVIAFTGYERADVIASVVVALMILPRAWTLLREAVDVLLEATPKGVDLEEVRKHLCEVPGVRSVHDLHAWTITSGMPVLSAHVVVDERVIGDGKSGEILDSLLHCLSRHFDVEHSTFQIEPPRHSDHELALHD